MKKRGYVKNIILLASVMLIGAVTGLIIAGQVNLWPGLEAQARVETPQNLQDAFVTVAEEVGKAVVSISTEYTVGGSSLPFRGFGDDLFDQFFQDFFNGVPQREYKQQGLGSGVIINSEGYILTNAHVVNRADKITVTLPDGREFKGEIKGKDERMDLAVIKVSAANLPTAELGDSDQVKVGQWAIAVGNPFGFAVRSAKPTVTVGVISALGRSLPRTSSRDRGFYDLIQTDAAINPGNSGGPLVNIDGKIIGINVAIFTTSGGSEGIGFAIPINQTKTVLDRLIAGKKIIYGWLGIGIQDLDENLAKYFGLSGPNGVLVASVVPDSPAQIGGMEKGDIITQYNNENLNNTQDLLKNIAKTEVGKKVKIKVIRNKQPLTLTIEVQQRPNEDIEQIKGTTVESSGWRGVQIETLDERLRQQYGILEKNGVLVTAVEPNSPADDANISAGDVIFEINHQNITNIDNFKNLTAKIKGDALVRTNRGYVIVKE
ncbi:MAG: Do family serine endopeptidase [Candidatus Omnitrophota bacterium]